MNQEKQIQEYESKLLIDKLSKMPTMVIATAYLHAINYTLYGEDVTEKWVTATQNANALEKAYRKGYYDAMQKQTKREERLEILLYNAIDMLLTQYDRADILDNIGMTLDEYNQVMETDKEDKE